jgi:antitoxin ParD1/3/4
MTNVDKRSVTLSPELAAEVDGAVAAGEYASASEVVRDALRQWKERRDLFGYTLEELRALVQEGIDSGPGRYASMTEIKAEARRRFVQANKRSA